MNTLHKETDIWNTTHPFKIQGQPRKGWKTTFCNSIQKEDTVDPRVINCEYYEKKIYIPHEAQDLEMNMWER